VRTVAHWAIPTSLEAYYQEAGRGGRDGRPARAVLLASRMDLGRLIRFNTDRSTTVEDVRAYLATLARRARSEDPADPGDNPTDPGAHPPTATVELAPGELADEERVLLSIAERAGAAELEPGARGGLRVRLTGRLDGRAAHQALKAARDRGWESYRAIERFIANDDECRRRQILEHFGDPQQGVPEGRCCSVCDPDPELERALAATTRVTRSTPRATPPLGNASAAHNGAGVGPDGIAPYAPAPPPEPVDEREYDVLREWRMGRAEGKPAYTVAPNAVLEEILRCRPSSTEEMITIRGIGPAFCERHGESLLEALAAL